MEIKKKKNQMYIGPRLRLIHARIYLKRQVNNMQSHSIKNLKEI